MERIRSLQDAAPRQYTCSTLRNGSANLALRLNYQNPATALVPDALAPLHLASPAERQRRVRDVLKWAWRIYAADAISMIAAVMEAAAGAPTSYYALVELRRVLLAVNLVDWEKHPHRTRADVHRLFRKAITRLSPHSGGWRVSR